MVLRRHAASSLSSPDIMPVLSRGGHRSPRKGACFMELASFLAGEPWSDHPSCTHPLLASLARDVNDHVDPRTAARLDEVPQARDWARGFSALGWGSTSSFAKRSAPAIVHSAVSGIAAAAVSDADDILVDLVQRTIVLCRGWFRHETLPVGDDLWRETVRMTHRLDRSRI